MKIFIRIFLFFSLIFLVFLPSAHAETLQERLNNLVGPKQQYDTMLSPAYLRTNRTEEEISPQSGSLSIVQTDYVLPGRNGLDLELKRIYKNQTANVQEMKVKYVDGAWVDYVYSDATTSSFDEDRYNLGIGMRFSFPEMEIRKNSDGTSYKFLHTDSGDIYTLAEFRENGVPVYYPEGQTIKDVVVKESAEFKNSQADGVSKYVMSDKAGKKTYFAEDGRILGIVDRYGNTIQFEYSTLSYTTDGQAITKRLISKIIDTVGRVVTLDYVEDHSLTVGPITADSYGADDYYQASQNPNSTDSGDLKNKFQVVVHLPGNQSIIYDKSAVLVSASKHVIRTRLQRVFGTDQKIKYHLWYEQPDLGFTYNNGTKYSVYNRYENLVQISEAATNHVYRYVYNTYTKRLNEGSMQIRKIFEQQDLVKKGYNAAAANFLDKFTAEVKSKLTYTYTNEADGFGTTGYKANDDSYLKDTYRYYTKITDSGGSTTTYTYNGKQDLMATEKFGKDHRQVITNERDEMKLVKKEVTEDYAVVDGKSTGDPLRKIKNFHYDEYGNLLNYVGPEAARDSLGNPLNDEHMVVYSYDYSKFQALTKKTWKQDADTTSQINYTVDDKGNVTKEMKSNSDPNHPWEITEHTYDSYGNLIKTTVHSDKDVVTYYEYGRDANGTDTQGAYLTKEYQYWNGKENAKTYAYDMNTGNLVFETDPKGIKTSYQYDALYRVTRKTLGNDRAMEYRYEDNPYANFRIQFTDLNNNSFLYEYDIEGTLVKSSILNQGAWHTLSAMEYDAFENLTKETDSNGNSTRYEYDSSQRLIKKTAYESDKVAKGTTTLSYRLNADSRTTVLSITDEAGYTQNYYYDILEQLIKQEVTPDKSTYYTSLYTYDYVGNQMSATDGRNNTTHFEYDHLDRNTRVTDPLGNQTTTTYNADDQIMMQKEPGGKITEYTYDELGRNTLKKVYEEGSTDYYYSTTSYDAVGNVIKNTEGKFTGGVNRDSSRVTYAYDNIGQLTDEYPAIDDSQSGHIHYEYDANGNQTKAIEYGENDGSLLRTSTTEYDFDNRVTRETTSLKEIAGNGATVVHGTTEEKMTYDYEGNMLSQQQFDGQSYNTTTYTYDYRNQMVTKVAPFNGQAVQRTSYQYDKVGNRTAETTLIQGVESTTTFTFDGMGRTVEQIDPLGDITRYAYDAEDNLMKTVDPRYFSKSMEIAPGTENEYDALNRLVKTSSFDGKNREVIGYTEYADNSELVSKDVDGEGYNAGHPELSVGIIYQYDVLDNPVAVISAQTAQLNSGNGTKLFTKQMSYDGSGHVLAETDALGRTTTYDYDLRGNLKQTRYADGTHETYEYDLAGDMYTIMTDKAGRTTKIYNTVFGTPYLKEYPDGTTETFRYSGKGELLEEQDQLGNSNYYTYDAAGNVTETKEYIRSDAGKDYYRLTSTAFNEAGQPISEETFLYCAEKSSGKEISRTSAGDRIENVYDKAGQLIKVSGPLDREMKREYDLAGNLITEQNKVSADSNEVTRFEYDDRMRLVKKSLLIKTGDISSSYYAGAKFDSVYPERLLSSTLLQYNKADKLVSETDANGHITLYEYDYDMNQVKKTDPAGGTTLYKYDLAGNMSAETDPLGSTYRYDYDELNRIIRKSAPAAGGGTATTRYVYDAMGNLTREIAPNQYLEDKDQPALLSALPATVYTYDNMNRQTAVISPDGSGVNYTGYDAKGRVIKATDGLQYKGSLAASKGTVYSYDGLDQLVKETDAIGNSTTYEYNVLGQVTKQTDARGNPTTYAYQADGTLSKAVFADSSSIQYTYDKLGRKISQTDQLGRATLFSYNAFGKETSIKDVYGNTVEYKYDLKGNLVSEKDKRGSITLLKYDAADRLVEKRAPIELDSSKNNIYSVETYSYDAAGNLVKKKLVSSKDSSYYLENTYTYYDNNMLMTAADNSGFYSKSEYDKNGNLLKVVKLRDSSGDDIVKYEYDLQNRVVKQIRLLDEQDIDTSADLPNLANLKDPEYPGKIDQITGYVYDVMGNKVKEIQPGAYGYLAEDQVNRNLFTVTYTYDLLSRVDKIISKYNGKDVYKQFSYDEVSNRTAVRDEQNNITQYVYDALNRLVSTTDAAGNVFSVEYDLGGNKTADINSKGDKMTYTYDKLNRLVLTRDPYDAVITQNIYDANGNIIKRMDAKGYAAESSDKDRYGTAFTYNLANQLVAVQDPETAANGTGQELTFSYAYDVLGHVVQETDALGNVTKYAYDSAGDLLKVTDPSGSSVTYEYDRVGNKLSMKDSRGKVTQYEYGAFSLLRAVTDAANQMTQYIYDLALNKQAMTDPLGNKTRYTYNPQNALTEVKVLETGDRILYGYDEVGNRISMTDESGTRSYVYDALYQLLKILNGGETELAYTYDAVGNVKSVTDKLSHVTNYTYDKSNRMEQVSYDGNKTTYVYDANGNRQSFTHSGGVKEVYSYDKNNRVTGVINKQPDGSVISSYSYTYDKAGRQKTKKDGYGTTTYTYDQEGRIKLVESPGKTTAYTYDGSGNRLTMQETYVSMQPSGYVDPATKEDVSYKLKKSQYVYSATNELVQLEEKMLDADSNEVIFKTTGYLYDANGNELSQKVSYTRQHNSGMRTSTGGSVYGETQAGEIASMIEKVTQTFDGFNRLKSSVKVKAGNRVTLTYQYDGDGLRREKTVSSSRDGYKAQTTHYTYDRQHVILETGENGAMLNRYIRGINYIAHFDKANQVTDYLYNEHGDVVQTVTKAGAIVNQYDYDAFGNASLTIETKDEPIRYGGEFFDKETGLYYLRARYYNPYTGRFISEDSYWGEQKNPLSLNMYTYAENDPIQFVDPTGHSIFGKFKEAVSSVTNAVVSSTKAVASSVANAVVSSTKAVASTVKSAAVSTAKAVVSTTTAVASTVKTAVVTTAKAAVSTTIATVSKAKSAVVTTAKAIANTATAAVSKGKAAVVTATKATAKVVQAVGTNTAKAVVSATQAVINTTKAVANTAKSSVVSTAKATKAVVTTAKAAVVTTAKAAVTSAQAALSSTAKKVASMAKEVASTAKATAVSATRAVVNASKPVVASAKNILSETKKGLDITRKQDTPLARSINQAVGIAEGAWSFGKSTVTGITSAVAHPIETVKGLGQAVAHPIQTGKAIGGAISAEWSKNVTGDSADTRSRAKFFTESVLTLGSFFVGAGELKAVATASKVEKTVEAATVATDVAKAGTTASKVADVVPEIVTSAPRPGRLKLDLQHFASDAEGTGKGAVDEYGILKKDTSVPGQAHHLNQDAAYRDVIPTNKGMSTKLEGNAFSEAGSPHYNAHESLEQFWNQYRRGGANFGEVPTNLEYSKAMVDSLKSAGYTQQEAMKTAAKAVEQRVQHGLLGGMPVPRIPGKINQSPRP